MKMTINEALTTLEDLQKDYQDFHDEVWKDPETYSINAESLKIAIETMYKYQKIQEIYLKWNRNYGISTSSAWTEVIEVLEDRNDD